MQRLAIFVDAGYLFAQGATAMTGSKKPRTDLSLNETAAIAQLLKTADELSGQIPLLRIYWYDAINVRLGPTADHERLAYSSNVKVRFGALNGHGQQKGVDSLIVTDIIELARNRAISDAVLLSGDEDVRVGVQLAQNHGVRVHLIGIAPSRGSQSIALIQEADTHTEWNAATVSAFLTLRASPPVAAAAKKEAKEAVPTQTVAELEAKVKEKPAPASDHPDFYRAAIEKAHPGSADGLMNFVASHAAQLVQNDRLKLKTYWETKSDIPHEFDGRLLAKASEAIGHRLSAQEVRFVRLGFRLSLLNA
ncbi:MAG: NYN domain-containing protein [Pseudomonas oryzihabitans]